MRGEASFSVSDRLLTLPLCRRCSMALTEVHLFACSMSNLPVVVARSHPIESASSGSGRAIRTVFAMGIYMQLEGRFPLLHWEWNQSVQNGMPSAVAVLSAFTHTLSCSFLVACVGWHWKLQQWPLRLFALLLPPCSVASKITLTTAVSAADDAKKTATQWWHWLQGKACRPTALLLLLFLGISVALLIFAFLLSAQQFKVK